MKLFIVFCFAAAAFGQGTPFDCQSVYTFTGTGTQTGQNNASSASPCIAWRVTYTTTGFSSVTVKFQTSPDNSNWTDVVNSICSSSVQPPCVTDGANPLAAGVMGSSSFRAYGKYVRANVTSVTGSGSGQIVTYGYKGTSASAGLGGGGEATSPGGSDGQFQYNNNGAFGGLAGPSAANALALSGSIVGTGSLNMPVAGMSCGKVILGFAALTSGSSAQEIPFLVVPAAFHIDMIRVNPATVFTYSSVGTTLTVSVQQQGNASSPDIIPPLNIATGGTFLEDIPANPNLAGHTISCNIIGDTTFTHLNAGSLQVTYCGHVVL